MKATNLIDVSLDSVWVESKKKERFFMPFGKEGKKWKAFVTLSLTDNVLERKIAEWFYLVAMSPAQYTEEYADGCTPAYVVQMDVFNLTAVEAEARKRLKKVHANTWDEFYTQMSQYFLYEENE